MMSSKQELQFDLKKYLDRHLDEKILALPLEFQYLPVEIISKQFTKLNSNHSYRIHYLGPRFTTTQILHKKYSNSGNQKETNLFESILDYNRYSVQMRKIIQSNYLNEKLQDNHYYKSAIFYRAFEGMNPTLNLKEQLLFKSCFESGNLDCVIKINPTEFDLFLRIDSNTRGHTQWFYFGVQNGNKTGRITFNLCNLTKPKTLYESGMRPYIFSKNKYEKLGRSWQQDGENVELVEKKLRYNIVYEMTETSTVFKLSFDYVFDEVDDEVYFAYSIPYTYSQLLKDISEIPNKFAKKDILGKSLTGVEIPILHITNFENNKANKKNILITGRIHPGQSNGSYVLKGFLDFLCSSNQHAVELRNRINFIVIPMVNPDGVIMGNSRSCASGKDLNREYLHSKRELYPEVYLIKSLVYKLQKNERLLMYFDFHGHSRKKNTFFYGPSYTLSEPQYYKSRALAKVIEKVNNSFRYYSCSFMISEQKKRTARAVLFQQYKIPYVFTIQSSIGQFYDVNKLKTIDFTEGEWKKIGANICEGISQFIVAYEQYEQMIRERRAQRQKRKQKMMKRNQKKFYEDFEEIEEQNISINQKKSSLMFDLLQEIKQIPVPKNADPQASSDDHDQNEDLESSKLAEFNNLVIQSKQKDKQMRNLSKIEEESVMEEFIDPPKRTQTENDEFQIMKEINDTKKSRPVVKNVKSSSVTSPQEPIPRSNRFLSTATIKRRNSSTYGSTSVKLASQQKRNSMIMGRQQKKNANAETHRHIISKQFFPLDRCEILQLPKSSLTSRKQIKKGRVLINQYLSDKRHQLVSKSEKPRKQILEMSNNRSMNKLGREKLEEFKMSKLQQNKFLDKKKLMENRNSNRIFDSVLFSGFHGMEIDNMAMMIRTFNR